MSNVPPTLYPSDETEPKVKILIGEDERPVLVPVAWLFRLSARFAEHVIMELPRRGPSFICREISVEVFRRLNEFQVHKSYTMPAADAVLHPTERPINEEGEKSDVIRRQVFAKYTNPAYSITGWASWVVIPHIFNDQVIRAHAIDFLNHFSDVLSHTPHPAVIGEGILRLHANIYVVASTYEMEQLQPFAMKTLLRTIFDAHLTYDFAGAFAKTVSYLFRETKAGDPIREPIIRIGTLVGFIFSPHPDFHKLVTECEEFRTAVGAHEMHKRISAAYDD